MVFDLGNAMGFINDMGNFDSDGLKAFTKSFESKLNISDNTKNLVNETIVGFGAKTVNFIFGAMFILLVIIVWILVPIGVINVMIAVAITVGIGIFLWIAAVIYRNSLDESINGALNNINSKLGTYAEEFATGMIGTFNEATSEYSKAKKSKQPSKHKKKSPDFEFEE